MSRRPARHRKPPRFAPARRNVPARPHDSSLTGPGLRYKLGWAGATVAGSALAASGWLVAASSPQSTPLATAMNQATALHSLALAPHPGTQPSEAGAGPLAMSSARDAPGHVGKHRKPAAGKPAADKPAATMAAVPRHAAPQPVYLNPLRAVSGLIPERIDEGVDFGGTGPVYALGDAVITNATASNYGWPGGGWITYQLTDGPDKGLMVFLAEDVTPTVQVGQHVTASTVIANMFDGGDGIETGWAQPDGSTAESQLPVAGGIGGYGPFPTMIGLNFEEMLQSLGVPAANNRYDPPSGVLPANYPTSWQ